MLFRLNNAPDPFKSQDPAHLSPQAESGSRFLHLDALRGLFFILMTSTHAMTLANLPQNHFFRSRLWLPRGWATYGFITLSGYTIAYVFNWYKDHTNIGAKLQSRGWRLLGIMFASNIVLLALAAASKNNIAPIEHSAWWIGLLTGKTEYSISAILFPTALFLFASGLAYRMVKALGAPLVLGFAIVSSCGAAILRNYLSANPVHSPLVEVFISPGLGGFNIFNLWFCGWIGFALGFMYKKGLSAALYRTMAIGSVAVTLIFLYTAPEAESGILGELFYRPCRFVALMTMVTVLLRFAGTEKILAFAANIGRYALFSFIVHRILLQATHLFIVRMNPGYQPGTNYVLMVVNTILATYLLCRIRDESDSVDYVLKSASL